MADVEQVAGGDAASRVDAFGLLAPLRAADLPAWS